MITFNNIPDTIRTPGTYVEIDNSRALQGLVANPHKVLIIGEGIVGEGNKPLLTLEAITRDNLADGYFGVGSPLARMCNFFKENNPNTELYAIRVSGGTTQASARINFSVLLSHAGAVSTNNEVVKMLLNGKKAHVTLTSNWSAEDIGSAFETLINGDSTYGFTATRPSGVAGSNFLDISCVFSGELGNYADVRFNYYEGESWPTCFDSVININSVVSGFEGGVGNPDIGDVWAIVANEQFQHIIQPYIDSGNLTEIEDELEDRFKPLEDKAGHGYTCVRGTQASCTFLGNQRNSPHNTMMGVYDSPTSPEEWAAALGAQAAGKLENDPARPLHYVTLDGVLPPPQVNRFTQTERDILLYDGIATYIVDGAGNVLIERSITTYQTNAAGVIDPSYLDIQTLFTLIEIRYQFKARMLTRFIIPRFKLADDTFPVRTGSYVVTPKTIKQEIIALFTELQEAGLIENLQEFIDNLIVERDSADRNRVNVLLPPDLINQFRILAAQIGFIL
jgi:phage tail sheath gpL-like